MRRIDAEDAVADESYFIARAEESLCMARMAEDAVARLIHYDLAGRYAVAAMRSWSGRPGATNSGPDLDPSLFARWSGPELG